MSPASNDRPFNMRLSDRLLRDIDEWRRQQSDLPGRSEAMRRLLQWALQQHSRPAQHSPEETSLPG